MSLHRSDAPTLGNTPDVLRAQLVTMTAERDDLKRRNVALADVLRTIQAWSAAELHTEHDYARMAEAVHKRTIEALAANEGPL